MTQRILLLLSMAVGVMACGGPGTDAMVGTDALPGLDSGPSDSGPPAPFELTSTAFVSGGMVPLQYECGPPLAMGPGNNISPPLGWTAGPPQTMSYALVMRDEDFGGFVHWVIYDIPANRLSLPEDVPEGYAPATVPGAHQAELQGSGFFGYLGPCSPGSVNTYRFTIHALPTPTLAGVDMSSTESAAAAAVEAASIAAAVLDGES